MATGEAEKLTYEVLCKAVESAAAWRCRRRLQPAGGEGDKVFPPTYAGAVYAIEQRRVKNTEGKWETVTCVLLDSVQSQANRMEEALQRAVDEQKIELPIIVVDFAGSATREQLKDPIVEQVTSLTVPHRLADALLRDSIEAKTGKMFRDGAHAARWRVATAANATPIYELCPTALIFGVWGSPEKPGGLGTKFERAIVSEVAAVGCPDWLLQSPWRPQRYGLKSTPVPISSSVSIVPDKDSLTGWKLANTSASKGVLRPSEINHGNVTYPSLGKPSPNVGITADLIEQTTTLSLIALRRLRFPPKEGATSDPAVDAAARVLLAAIGLFAAALAFGPGMDLRSRCVLFPEEAMTWDLLDAPGQSPKRYALDPVPALALFKDAVAAAKKVGLPWNTEPVVLTPSKQLLELVRKSQELTAKSGEEGEG